MRALKTVSIDGLERAWVEVDLQALVCNYRALLEALPSGCQALPMVKADAYGLGVSRCVRALAPLELVQRAVGHLTADIREASPKCHSRYGHEVKLK